MKKYLHIKYMLLLAFAAITLSGFSMDLSTAQKYYEDHQYKQFISEVKKALIENPHLKNDIQLNAKIAYALSQDKRFDVSEQIWLKLLKKSNILRSYIWWYRGINQLYAGDTTFAISIWSEGVQEEPNGLLTPKMTYYVSELCAALKNYNDAFLWMEILYHSQETAGHKKSFLLNLMIKYADSDKNREKALHYFEILTDKYPGSSESYQWAIKYNYFADAKKLGKDEQIKALKILYYNGKYKDAIAYIKSLEKIPDIEIKNTLKFYRAQIYFSQKKYKSAYNLFNSLKLSQFKIATQRQILRQKGRSLYRMGQRTNAYKVFEELAKKFPAWNKSLELLWVAAMNYEKKGQYSQAKKWYKKIINLNHNNLYAWRARFRIGFMAYSNGKFSEAKKSFEPVANSKIWYLWKDRARYWIAKSDEKLGNHDMAYSTYEKLASRPVVDYYTMKSYLILNHSIENGIWQHAFTGFDNNKLTIDDHFNKYLDEFRPALLIEEIFGQREAQFWLDNYEIRSNMDLSYYLALIQLSQKIGSYGSAYIMQVRIVNKYFGNLPFTLDSPVVKYLFPLFFDDAVFDESKENDIEPEIVFAVMRQESAFKHDAESRAGARGLLQLMPGTAKEVHDQLYKDPYDEDKLIESDYNIQLGVKYLAKMVSQFDGNYYYSLAAYNAGAHRVKKWNKEINSNDIDIFLESITFNETRNYVRVCMRNYWAYKIILGSSPYDLAQKMNFSHPLLEAKKW